MSDKEKGSTPEDASKMDLLIEKIKDVDGAEELLGEAIAESTLQETASLKKKNEKKIGENQKLRDRIEELETALEKFEGISEDGDDEVNPEEVRAALEFYRNRDKGDNAAETLDATRRENRQLKKDVDKKTKELEKANKKLGARENQIKTLFKEELRAELGTVKVIPEMMRGAAGEFDLKFIDNEDGDISATVEFDGEDMPIKEAVKEWSSSTGAKWYIQSRQDLGGGERQRVPGSPETKKWSDLNLTEKNEMALKDRKRAEKLAAAEGIEL